MNSKDPFALSNIPRQPAVYAMYDRSNGIAYVGISKALRDRIDQHINRRDSSVTTGVSATSLNPDKITQIKWWLHTSFSDKKQLEAAELIAFETFNPALRSRGRIMDEARRIANESSFKSEMEDLFRGNPSGIFIPKNLDNIVRLVLDLQERIKTLESK